MTGTTQSRRVGFMKACSALVLLACLLFPLRDSLANDILITNLTVHPHNGGNGEVEFDITWSNSWRVTPPLEPYNWDAAWVFCKIRRNGGDWTHLKLSTTGHTIPSSPIAITTALGLADPTIAHDSSTNPAVGIFMYRTNDGFGTFTANDVRLRWNYADNGASSGDVIEIRVLAMEMVYIPEGAFYAGDGSPNTGGTTARLKQGSSDTDPWYITSENAISVTNASSDGYYYVSGTGIAVEDSTGTTFTIPAAFPKGYGPFYMMKGEISQGQYVAFFNMLTNSQKSELDITALGYKNSDNISFRNNISWTGSGEATLNGGTHSGVAMSYMGWYQLAPMLAWSGLRPMSELEYEKACRGPKAAVSGEYAWGSTSITGATSISNSGLGSERGHTGSNIAYNGVAGVQGPLRVGSFAKGVNTRIASGAGFYGVMELSGNVTEQAISVGVSEGRSFQRRRHGNGVLVWSDDVFSLVESWPYMRNDPETGYYLYGRGVGTRGGSWSMGSSYARISDRESAASPNGGNNSGGRGVRSAP